MDRQTLSAMLTAASSDPLILNSVNSPLNALAFNVQSFSATTNDTTHNHHQANRIPSLLFNSQLNAALTANLKLDNQFSVSLPNNNFIAASSPLSSIGSSLSSNATTDVSPAPFTTLSALSPADLQNLTKLVAQSINPALVTASTPNQTLSDAHSSTTAAAAMISQIDSSSPPQPSNDEQSISTRRIRRRRPKSNSSSQPHSSKKPNNNTVLEIKQEEQQPADEPELMDDTTMNPMPGSSNFYNNNSNDEMNEQLSEEEMSRRQKTCKVCGDHATGYNFNVISCESCKAFFRRNALRQKDFKCPYSGDCEINAVSRRFCQLCRLKKCFIVGMKKEWILNDEQLKRRKNSRLNSLKSVGSVSSNDPVSPQQIQHCSRSATLHSPLPPLPSILTARSQSIDESIVKREPIEQPILNQLPTQHQILPQTPAFISPLQLNENIRMLQEQANNNNITLHQILNAATTQQTQSFMPLLSQYNRMPQINSNETMAQQQLKAPVVEKPIEQPNIQQQSLPSETLMRTNLQQMANVSVEEYTQQFLQSRISQASTVYTPTQYNLPPTSTPLPPTILPPTSLPQSDNSAQNNYDQSNTPNMAASPVESPQQSSSQLSSPNGSFSFPSFFNWSPATFKLMEESIQEEFESAFPDENHDTPNHIEFKETTHEDPQVNYQLNSSELLELDVVRNAYGCLNEALNDKSDTETLKKKDHSVSDVMNIIDIVMRRFVKMTKKLPAFNSLTQDSKLALLKSSMIKMVTIRGAARFDPKRFSWTIVQPGRHSVNVSCNIFDKLNDGSQKSNFIRFCMSMHDVIRQNEILLNLIGLIILFGNADVINNEKDKALAQKYHDLYNNLLRRYVESIHGNDSKPIIDSVPVALSELNRMSVVSETIFVGKVNTEDSTRKLPLEFFKVKPDDVQTSPTTSA